MPQQLPVVSSEYILFLSFPFLHIIMYSWLFMQQMCFNHFNQILFDVQIVLTLVSVSLTQFHQLSVTSNSVKTEYPKFNLYISSPSHVSKEPWFFFDENIRHSNLDFSIYYCCSSLCFCAFSVDRLRKYTFLKNGADDEFAPTFLSLSITDIFSQLIVVGTVLHIVKCLAAFSVSSVAPTPQLCKPKLSLDIIKCTRVGMGEGSKNV